MLRNKALIISAILLAGILSANAQSSTNSPYTRYGLGDISSQAFTSNAAMGGIGYGLRNHYHINTMNPASYTSVDSLSFMFDMGFSLKSSNYKENGIKSNAKNSAFDYMAMQFRLHKRLGMVIGFTPFSNVGYNFSQQTKIKSENGESNLEKDTYFTNTFYGDGGLQQIFGGLGFKITKNLSFGANFGYLYGDINYSTTGTPSNGGDYRVEYNNIDIKTYKLDLGMQYTLPLKKDNITFGITYGLGHDVNSQETKGDQITNGIDYEETQEDIVKDAYAIPHTIGAGIVWEHNNKIKLGFDYSLQKWEGIKYDNQTNRYNNRNRIAAGMEYTPNHMGRKYLSRVFYRIGTSYQNSYLKLPDGNDGPDEFSVSAGFGFPLNKYQRNSVLSITGEYTRVKPSVKDMLSENRFMIKLGLTFNERWFMKWRVN